MVSLARWDRRAGWCLLVLGLAALATVPRPGVVAGVLGPGVLPSLVAAALAAAGLALVLSRRAGRRGARPEEAPAWPGPAGSKRLLVTAAATVAYVAALPRAGFPLASAAYVAAMAWYLGERRALVAVAWGLAVAAALWAGFVRGLGLPLPAGPLGPGL